MRHPAVSASEPGANLAPRLDRREQNLPGAHLHCSSSAANGQRHRVLVAADVVCSRVVTDVSRRGILRPAIAATSVAERRGAGRRAGVIGPAGRARNGAALSSGVIGNGGVNGQLRPRRRQRRARASAQRSHTPILWSGRAIGPAVTRCSRCRPKGRAGVFAVWPAAGSYGVCWIARHTIANGGGAGGANVRPPGSVLPTPPEACLSVWEPRPRRLTLPPTPKRRKERVGGTMLFSPRFLSSEGAAQRVRRWVGTKALSGRCHSLLWATAIAATVWPIRPPRRRWPARCGVGVSWPRWWRARGERSWKCSTASSAARRHGRWPG